MSNILLICITSALIYYAAGRHFHSEGIGLLTSLICVSMPRIAGQAMLGDTDSTLYSLSFPAVLSGYLAGRHRSAAWAILCGVLCGLCMGTKFTGLLIPFGILVWMILYCRHDFIRNAIFIVVLAPITFLILNPYLWQDPIHRSIAFVIRSISFYSTQPHVGYIFGKLFRTTPFYYHVVYIFATIPPLQLVLSSAGFAYVIKNRFADSFAGLSALIASLFLLVILMPHSVAFDGVRFFLVSFLFSGLMAGWALHRWWHVLQRRVIFILLVITTILPLAFSHPFELEYYAPQIGGISGASKLKLEISYWWDAANPEFHSQANKILPVNANVALFPSDPPFQNYYRAQKYLNGTIVDPKNSQFMVVLCRPSCDDPRLISFVRQWYPQPVFRMVYPDQTVPYVILLQNPATPK